MLLSKVLEGIQEEVSQTGDIDRITLISVLHFLGELLSTLVGILVVVIIIFVPLVCMIEILYINFPILQKPLDRLVDNGKPLVSRVASILLWDAIKAVEAVTTGETERNVNTVYLILKIKSLWIVFFVIGLAIMGGRTIIDFVASLLGGFINFIIQSIG